MLKMLNLKEEIIGITVWNKNLFFLFPSILFFTAAIKDYVFFSFFLLGFKVRGVASLTDIWMLVWYSSSINFVFQF